jgi:uncharacterized protein (TIGR00645 family)
MVERHFERVLFAGRWLLAPFYFGLLIGLCVLLYKFLQETVHFVIHAPEASETDVITGVLSLIDLSLAGNLLMMVIFSGYENFVSKIDVADHADRPDWMGKIDFSGLKLKLLGSIVAISAIQLLRAFMDVRDLTDRELIWLAVIHVVFVVSSVALALSDWIAEKSHEVKTSDAGHGP